MKKTKFLTLAILFFPIIIYSQTTSNDIYKGLKEHPVSIPELQKWHFYGQGELLNLGGQICLKEADNSNGVMLISPHSFGKDVIVKYQVMSLTPATVLVTMLNISDPGNTTDLSIPDDYDGSMNLWSNQKQNYFFAFKNAPHGVNPFVRRNPGSKAPLVSGERDLMVSGIYFDVEVGKVGNNLWLSIDNQLIFEAEDNIEISGGRLAFRIRGTAGFNAGCLIRNVAIFTKETH